MACNNTHSNSFKLEGSIENAKDSDNILLYYYLLKNGEWQEIGDTAKIINGKFLFEGNIEELTAASLCFEDTGAHVVIDARMYIEPTTMKLRINKDQPYAYKLSGTTVEKENMELRKETESYEKSLYEDLKRIDKVIKQISSNDNNNPALDSLINLMQSVKEHYSSIRLKIDSMYFDFILRHNTYQIVPDLLYLLTKSETVPVDTLKRIYNNLPEQSKIGLMGKFAFKQIESFKSESEEVPTEDPLIGKTAPDFTRKDFSGKTIKLSDFKNKNYVLLDFWASWCLPCVEGIPKIKDLYNKYNKKGLTIISISFDKDDDSWRNAINKYQLKAWTQILQAEDKNNSVANTDDINLMYNVEAIPHFVLIDKQGKIIVNGIGGEQLDIIDKMLRDK